MSTETPWVRKYAPKNTGEIIGHASAIAQVRKYLTQSSIKDKPLLLVSGPGMGKTSMVHALAKELDIELLEVNASDSRNKDAIDTIIGGAAKQRSLFFRPKAILIDEVDGVSGMQDRGGVAALVSIIAQSGCPMIFTANDRDSDKLKPLLKACNVIELSPASHDELRSHLERIAKAEQVSISSEQLSALCRRSGSDIRSLINDLQSLAQGKMITKEDIDSLGDREAKEEVEQALLRIFKTTSADIALPAFDNVDEDVDALLLLIDENIPREYKTQEDLARAFDALADADKFFGRIRKWQYYRYYVYIYNLLTAGIALAKDKKYPGMTEYKPTGRILKMWIYNQKNAKRKKISQVLSPQLHTSSRRVRQEILPFLRIIYQKDKKQGKLICQQYGIDAEAEEWFSKTS